MNAQTGWNRRRFFRTLSSSLPLLPTIAQSAAAYPLPIKRSTSTAALPELEAYCSEFLCTYVDAEGKLQGTNLDWFRKLRAATRLPITAAGGITTDEEIRSLDELGMHAALGMAIYRRVFPELFRS